MPELKDRMKTAAELMEVHGLLRIEWTGKDWSVELGMEASAPAAAIQGGPAPAARRRPKPAAGKGRSAAAPVGRPINSPMMGVYYSSPSPGSEPFVSVGDVVKAGQVVGLIEAMKVFNEITAPTDGRVIALPLENGSLVQAGEAILVLD